MLVICKIADIRRYGRLVLDVSLSAGVGLFPVRVDFVDSCGIAHTGIVPIYLAICDENQALLLSGLRIIPV